MKKTGTLIALFLALFAFASCSKKAVIDEYGWYSVFSEAKKQAQKDNKSIILYFSALDTDKISESFNENIFKTEEFREKFSDDYVFCNIDFSNSRYNDVYLPDAKHPEGNSSDEENDETAVKKAGRSARETSRLQQQLSQDMLVANYYAVEAFPSVYVLTKQGYVVSPLILEDKADMDDFQKEIESMSAVKTQIANLLSVISTGKKDEVLDAINEFFDITDDRYKFLLDGLHEKYISLDKNNESGRTVEHILVLANARAQKALLEKDYEKAVKELASPLHYKILSPANRLQVYYSVGYFLASTGSTDYERIISYFEKAREANPESEFIPTVDMMIENAKYLMSHPVTQVPEAESE